MQARRKILVIDDEPVTLELFRSILAQANYDVILAQDGLSGFEAAQSERPDLVITDGLLPKMHGFLVCKAIKELASPPKVIVLTGLYTKPTYKWTVKHDYGADDLQVKPITPGDLLRCVEKQLAGLSYLDLPEPSPVPLPPNNQNSWQLAEPGADGEPRYDSGDVAFAKREMKAFSKGWAIPCS